ncbi:MAG: bifunctional serine/threonine-protein kinase/formylglycine-generating enzyme family protein [Pirellulaceae bacterium]|nr:SUMF1/EgtB/PvdO family nonheme iron enzyme [Planctomycetales bacterium]
MNDQASEGESRGPVGPDDRAPAHDKESLSHASIDGTEHTMDFVDSSADGTDMTYTFRSGIDDVTEATTDFQVVESRDDQTTPSASAAPGSGTASPKPPTIGRYRIVEKLGEGAFGAVFLTHDDQLDRQVAVKVAKHGLISGRGETDRFLREARAAAQLRHPHIVPVYEYGSVGPTNFIAYQFIKGQTLKELIKTHRFLPTDRTVDILAKIASALHYAHENNIVHRDMKPENILIDELGQPHVADFGCARHDESAATRTMEGSIMGTPAYMSPEQASGRSHLADGRSDIWSLGVMMEEMLTGARPFQGSVTEILVSIREHEPAPLRQLNPNISKDLETICQKCLAKLPEQRFQTAQELVDELQRYQRGEPIKSRPLSLAARTVRLAKRNPAVTSLLLLVFFALALGATVSSYFLSQMLREQRNRALAAVESLQNVEAANVGLVIDSSLSPFKHYVLPALKSEWQHLKTEAEASEHVTFASKPGSTQVHQHGEDDRYVRTRGRIGMALLGLYEHDHAGRPEIAEAVLEVMVDPATPPSEFRILRDRIHEDVDSDMKQQLWRIAEDYDVSRGTRLRAAAALALFDRDAANWQHLANDVVGQMLAEDRLNLSTWIQAMQPVRDHLAQRLEAEYANKKGNHQLASAVLVAETFSDDPLRLFRYLRTANEQQLAEILLHLEAIPVGERSKMIAKSLAELGGSSDEAVARANIEIGLFRLGGLSGERERLRRPLWDTADPTLRSIIIDRLGVSGIDPGLIRNRIAEIQLDREGRELSALILALGEFDIGMLPPNQRLAMKDLLISIFTTHPDPGVHSAVDWILRRWDDDQHADALAKMEDQPKESFVKLAGDALVASLQGPSPPKTRWQYTKAGLMVTFDPVDKFKMGSPREELGRAEPQVDGDEEFLHERQIPRTFQINSTEVTEKLYREFERDRIRDWLAEIAEMEARPLTDEEEVALENARSIVDRLRHDRPLVENESWPAGNVTWFDALRFCYWLGEQEKLPADQQCYPPPRDIELAVINTSGGNTQAQYASISLPPDLLERTGYRLPTAAEWEYACRATSTTARPIGDCDWLVPKYYWLIHNTNSHPEPVALLRPNPFGLFDMIGNVDEWCQDNFLVDAYSRQSGNLPVVDRLYETSGLREVRGGSFDESETQRVARSASRDRFEPVFGFPSVGFRVARTLQTTPEGSK